EANRRQNGMCRFQGRNDAFQSCAESKPFEGFYIARLCIFGSPAVVKKRVFRADCGVVEAGRDRMRRGDLTVRVLEYIGHRALKNANAPPAALQSAVKPRGVRA